MSLGAYGAVVEHSRSKGNARLVFLLLADEAAGPVLRLHADHVARKANMSEADVHRQITRLCEIGELDSLGDGTYRILVAGVNGQ